MKDGLLFTLLFSVLLISDTVTAQPKSSHVSASYHRTFITDGDYTGSLLSVEYAHQITERLALYGEGGYGISGRHTTRLDNDIADQWQYSHTALDIGMHWNISQDFNLWLSLAPSVMRWYQTRSTSTVIYTNYAQIDYEMDSGTIFRYTFGLEYRRELFPFLSLGVQVQSHRYPSDSQMVHSIGLVAVPSF